MSFSPDGNGNPFSCFFSKEKIEWTAGKWSNKMRYCFASKKIMHKYKIKKATSERK
ncbi:hypothetical protein [Flavobacterium sp.]|uniref:hypothetical protein n=1 Tax=Flavobacterium sp. TaxID=239 RepID=UPI0032649399